MAALGLKGTQVGETGDHVTTPSPNTHKYTHSRSHPGPAELGWVSESQIDYIIGTGGPSRGTLCAPVGRNAAAACGDATSCTDPVPAAREAPTDDTPGPYGKYDAFSDLWDPISGKKNPPRAEAYLHPPLRTRSRSGFPGVPTRCQPLVATVTMGTCGVSMAPREARHLVPAPSPHVRCLDVAGNNL